MLGLIICIFTRIFSNSSLNVLQKLLTKFGERSSIVNFYTYLGLTLLGLFFVKSLIFNFNLLIYIMIMGLLGALGNYFIIKALSEGELSELAPINSYKPVVALIFGIVVLSEIPNFKEIVGIILIIVGTFVLFNNKIKYSNALKYRTLALIFSGSEAIFIKKIILLSSVNSAFFYWAISGLIFSLIFLPVYPPKISVQNVKYQLLLIISAFVMQYTTNYIFSKMNVAYALAIFQLSTVVSIYFGMNIFKEKHIIRKTIASLIMISGAVLIILN